MNKPDPRKALGRGISALMPTKPVAQPQPPAEACAFLRVAALSRHELEVRGRIRLAIPDELAVGLV